MLKLPNKYKIFRVYGVDLWGSIRLGKKITNVSKKIVQRVRRRREYRRRRFKPFLFDVTQTTYVKPRKRKTTFGRLLASRQKACLFYGIVKLKHSRALCERADSGKGFRNDFGKKIVMSLEGSLGFLLYRVGFAKSLQEAFLHVEAGHILVDKKVVKSRRHVVRPGSLMEVISSEKEQFFLRFVERLELDEVLMVGPCHICVSYTHMNCMLLSDISLAKVYYPFRLDRKVFGSVYRGKVS